MVQILMLFMEAIAAPDPYGDFFTPQTFTSSVVPKTVDPRTETLRTKRILRLLMDRGANPNLADRDGNTAFHPIGKLSNIHPVSDGCYQIGALHGHPYRSCQGYPQIDANY